MSEKYRLGQYERRVLLQSLVVRASGLFEKLEAETMDLDVMDYFERYYKLLYKLIYCMERFYPGLDMSTNDIELLYKRIHMRDEQ